MDDTLVKAEDLDRYSSHDGDSGLNVGRRNRLEVLLLYCGQLWCAPALVQAQHSSFCASSPALLSSPAAGAGAEPMCRFCGATSCASRAAHLAPELHAAGGPASCEADVYALGVLAWCLLHNSMPFRGMPASTCAHISASGLRPVFAQHLAPSLKHLALRCMQQLPRDR
jgi:hypothetical protein